MKDLASDADLCFLSTEARHTFLPDLVIPLPTILALGSSWVVSLLVSGLFQAGFMVVC